MGEAGKTRDKQLRGAGLAFWGAWALGNPTEHPGVWRGRPETNSSEEWGWPSGAPGPWATLPSTLGDPTEHPGVTPLAPWATPLSTLGCGTLSSHC